MATTNDLKNGMTLNIDHGLWNVVEFQHVKPGKGPAFVRTKLKNVMSGKVVDRFIPARAGNARSRNDAFWLGCGSSPRVRGTPLSRAPTRSGIVLSSSPRVRGTPGCNAHRNRFPAVHPRACGNTPGAAGCMTWLPVHPRACGGTRYGRVCGMSARGSSPRVRGTPRPNARGPTGCGSSPRVRGTLRGAHRRGKSGRFIPARAGNTNTPLARAPICPVHPRACGEHERCASAAPVRGWFIPARAGNTWRLSAVTLYVSGSSPRVRGTHADVRTIPLAAVHPRACGEHRVLLLVGLLVIGGSSPRVRGTPTCIGL